MKNNLLPWLLLLVGMAVSRRKGPALPAPAPKRPGEPPATPPRTRAQREATPLGQTGLDFSVYPGRPGARAGGAAALERDWGQGVWAMATGQVYAAVEAAAEVRARNNEPLYDPKGQATMRLRGEVLAHVLETYLLGR